ncbi:hypothetical protein C1H46_029637 [Malus baccata]|uniref:Uncharacterized protein n=1 Tax=Malus baccata TaxID=106549 RepID=A0A540LEL4_MALBA|nr:hypothetical protein C1H46_029637 [Malus baccata]
MSSSSKGTKSLKNFPYSLPLTRVRTREEGQTFIENHQDLLGQSKVWCEPGQDIHAALTVLFDPQHPYTRIYPWFLYLDLHFPLSDFLKSILLCNNMAICNLSPATFRFITFFELLNQWYGAYLGIQEFRILHILMMSFDDHYYFSTRPSLV